MSSWRLNAVVLVLSLAGCGGSFRPENVAEQPVEVEQEPIAAPSASASERTPAAGVRHGEAPAGRGGRLSSRR
ncbi:MAG: hypothetical protein U0359_38840 [Byssovorax sp.]